MRKFKFIKIIYIFFLLFAMLEYGFSKAVTHVSPIDGIDWTFETTMGFQNLNNLLMSKEGSSSSQTNEALFFYGILYHAYYDKVPMIKAQMNLGFNDMTKIYWTENPDFNHGDQLLNETLRCIEFDAHYQMPSIVSYNGVFYPYVGYSYLNYSYAENYLNSGAETFKFHAFSVGVEYSTKYTRSIKQNYYLSFAPLMITQSGEKSFFYYNYGTEAIFDTHPVALTVFVAFRNGFNKNSRFFDRQTYTFSNSEIGLSFHVNLR